VEELFAGKLRFSSSVGAGDVSETHKWHDGFAQLFREWVQMAEVLKL
jgi:hypothetical protein